MESPPRQPRTLTTEMTFSGAVPQHTPLQKLVAGFGEIAPLPIPYARMPRRLGAYAQEFPRWSDVANQTPQALLSWPKVGDAAVRALVQAAQDAVKTLRNAVEVGRVGAEAAVARLVGQLDDFDREILSARVWAPHPQSQRVVAERLGVHPVSVQRNQARAQVRFAELLADPAHQEVGDHAAEIGRRLGPYLPADVVDVELRSLGVDPSRQAAQVLLHVAGPYVGRGQWVENTATGGHAQAVAAVDAVFVREPAPSTDSLLHALTSLGIPSGIALTYLESQVALRRFGDVWVRWTGDTAANMAEGVLHVLGAPATADIAPQSTRANPLFNFVAPKIAAFAFSAGFGAMYFPGMKAFVQGDIPILDGEVPAANGVCTARALARVYGAIANGGQLDGTRLLSPELVSGLTGRPSLRPDHNLFLPLPGTWDITRCLSRAYCRGSVTPVWVVRSGGPTRAAESRSALCTTGC